MKFLKHIENNFFCQKEGTMDGNTKSFTKTLCHSYVEKLVSDFNWPFQTLNQ